MGLAAPKNRSRISNDPQNTTWANNTSRFGHRILTSQGWTPGSTLGAQDANHASHYTTASNSHIRVLLKEDTLGLGAKRGSERAENFGLAGLESILGRLNGKEADVKKEEERRQEVERRGFVAQKYGFMNFVSGGYLVGDKIEKKVKKEVVVKVEVKEEEGVAEVEKEKKRKRSRDEVGVKEEDAEDEQPKLKRKKKSMNLREIAAAENEAQEIKSKSKSKSKSKKDKKKSKKSSTSEPESTELSSIPESPAPVSEEPLTDKSKRKAEKRARKEEKKLKKALKKAAKEAARSNKEATADSSSEDEDTGTPATSSVPTTGTSTPAGLSFAAGSRHAVRARYIRQKKMAGMDPQALREIFMMKSPV